MTLVKFNDWDNTFENNYHSFSDVLNNFFSRNEYCDDHRTVPGANISENEKNFQIEIAAPGLDKKEVKVEIEKDLLKISHHNSDKKTKDGKKYFRREFKYDGFKRTFIIPENVDESKLNAKFKNGVLLIELPKKEKSELEKKREIMIS